MTIWIEWEEYNRKFSHRRYIGNGEDIPVFETIRKVRRARYSDEVTPEMIARANDWIKSDRPGAKVVIA